MGYPIVEKGAEVESPFNYIFNHGADGTRALVLAVSYMKIESNGYRAHMFQGFHSKSHSMIWSRCMCREAIQSEPGGRTCVFLQPGDKKCSNKETNKDKELHCADIKLSHGSSCEW